MTNDDLAIYRAIRSAQQEGRSCALATVLATRGSTPRKTGAKMLIEPGRGLVGTIGGGCGEAEVIEAAGEVLLTGRPRVVNVNLTEDPLSWSGSICGGVLDVYVEPVVSGTDLRRDPDPRSGGKPEPGAEKEAP